MQGYAPLATNANTNSASPIVIVVPSSANNGSVIQLQTVPSTNTSHVDTPDLVAPVYTQKKLESSANQDDYD